MFYQKINMLENTLVAYIFYARPKDHRIKNVKLVRFFIKTHDITQMMLKVQFSVGFPNLFICLKYWQCYFKKLFINERGSNNFNI